MSYHRRPHTIMKSHKVLFLALLVSASLAVSAEAGDRHRDKGNGNAKTSSSSPSHYSGGAAIHSNSGFRYGGNRMIGSSQHFSSMSTRSMSTFPRLRDQRSNFRSGGNVASFNQRQFTPRTFDHSNRVARFETNRNLGTLQGRGGNRLSSLNNTDRT